jgi:hypothetical protein
LIASPTQARSDKLGKLGFDFDALRFQRQRQHERFIEMRVVFIDI